MFSIKALALVATFCAIAVSVNAGPYGGKTLELTSIVSKLKIFGDDATAKIGDIGVLQYTFQEKGAKLYQSGIYVEVESKSKLLNYDLTLVLSKAVGRFPKGSIFLVGSGTGLQDSATLPKEIVGGSGPYQGVSGTLTKKDGDKYVFKFK